MHHPRQLIVVKKILEKSHKHRGNNVISCQVSRYVVNMNGFITRNTSRSRVDIMVQMMMIAMVIKIGPKELLDRLEKRSDKADMVAMLKKPNA